MPPEAIGLESVDIANARSTTMKLREYFASLRWLVGDVDLRSEQMEREAPGEDDKEKIRANSSIATDDAKGSHWQETDREIILRRFCAVSYFRRGMKTTKPDTM